MLDGCPCHICKIEGEGCELEMPLLYITKEVSFVRTGSIEPAEAGFFVFGKPRVNLTQPEYERVKRTIKFDIFLLENRDFHKNLYFFG